ncbi:hypothetical protein Pmani_032956 [Petrolisthes manimaculis]|uniref:Uncharacterized protein n=1 Tax=Petrolisthes manimaculis TaxID=1843537 RepID=A0AAE1NSJ8_9EUCA|nr:hypothetical protein Pmani_032956 [Petrolisthes manimaculis]
MTTDWEQIREQLLTPDTLRLQRLSGVTNLMESLSESLLQSQNQGASSLTCPSCKVLKERVKDSIAVVVKFP